MADHDVRTLSKQEATSGVVSAHLFTGRTPKVRNLSEAGLYKLIMTSDAPGAGVFQDWVTREVLPSIRKTGTYSLAAGQEMPLPADFMTAMREMKSYR